MSHLTINFDLVGIQSPSDGPRGVGRYLRGLTAALEKHSDECRLQLFGFEELGTAALHGLPTECVRLFPSGNEPSKSLEEWACGRDSGADLFVCSTPFDESLGFRPPSRDRSELPLAVIGYDLIPLLYPDWYFADRSHRQRYENRAKIISNYDGVFAISEATRRDFARLLSMPDERLFPIGGAVNAADFSPCHPEATSATNAVENDEYFYAILGCDPRKNHSGLLAAFSLLPEELKSKLKLVLTCRATPLQETLLRAEARRLGIHRQLVLTGPLSDAELQGLLRGCRAFVFPSLYEGFGLPILEAMACGAPVITGDNSSLPEVAGDAAIQCDVSRHDQLAKQMETICRDESLREQLKQRGLERVQEFTWDKVAERFLAAASEMVSNANRLSTSVAPGGVAGARRSLPPVNLGETGGDPLSRPQPPDKETDTGKKDYDTHLSCSVTLPWKYRVLEQLFARLPWLIPLLRQSKRRLKRLLRR
ncbi:glycosyltransferase family 4 protein [Calycomorphotria hydatis]|uniref:Capsular glucan synthase n=1 Tax=Calycomorphotria hydatis TaxID=2528027 RepID=A0A517T5W1_9PLAN|nr:glycosyltransferase family 1 protein [Calycomorphotria hydatis]QDT63753.1 Capsular glucan synthase [Calycomorphotria hydatis]